MVVLRSLFVFALLLVMVCKWSVLCVAAQSDEPEEHGPELIRLCVGKEGVVDRWW